MTISSVKCFLSLPRGLNVNKIIELQFLQAFLSFKAQHQCHLLLEASLIPIWKAPLSSKPHSPLSIYYGYLCTHRILTSYKVLCSDKQNLFHTSMHTPGAKQISAQNECAVHEWTSE